MIRHAERIVRVDFPGYQGSGYLVSPRHVMTVAHMADSGLATGERGKVTFMTADDPHARLVADGTTGWVDQTLDVAVIRLDQPIACGRTRLRVAALREVRRLPFTCNGFPRGASEHMKNVYGELCYVPTGGYYDLDYQSSRFLDVTQWGGMSGAMVFHGDDAIAIVRRVSPNVDRKLTATPLASVVCAPGFANFWRDEHEPAFLLIDLDGRPPRPPAETPCEKVVAWCDRTREYLTLWRLTQRQHAHPRIIGLAGHVDHHAEEVLDRLKEELETKMGNVGLYTLRQYRAFRTLEELVWGIGEELEIGSHGTETGLDHGVAARKRLGAALVAIPVECDGLDPRTLRQRLDVLCRWLDAVRDFPCPVVVVLLLRWDGRARGGWLASLWRRVPDPEAAIQQAWLRYERERGLPGGEESALCTLTGYVREDVRCLMKHRRVAEFFEHRSFQVELRLNNWFGDRTHLTFRELSIHLATL